jgi:hypothetical protein
MQLSAANLIIASQQSARAQAQPSADAGPQFAAALKANNVETSDFEPMTFKQAAPASTAESPTTTPSGYGQSALLGGTIDIRV